MVNPTLSPSESSKNALRDGLQDSGLPVPVQTFLWRQITPFIRPKLGRLHEASCMVSASILSY